MTHKLKAFPYYQVAKIVSPADEPEQSRPYFLVETIYTSDGPRSRICSGRYTREEHALRVAEERSKGNYFKLGENDI